MTDQKGFRIEVSSRFDEFWRYNVAMTGGLFDARGERIGFASTEDTVAETGANLRRKPEGYPRDRTIVLETAPCQRLRLFVYLIPHTLPAGNTVADSRSFELQVAIRCGGRPLRTERFAVNQWSGASLELQLEAQPPQRPAAE